MQSTIAILLGFAGALTAATPKDWTAWQWESPVVVNQTGMMQLEVQPSVLDVSRPDLGDLRLLSPSGVETGYLVEIPRYREGGVRDATGFKVNLSGRTTVIEATGLSATAIDSAELVSPARDFLKSVSVEGRIGTGEWQPLATNEVIFRQASGAERMRIPIPKGMWQTLRFTIQDDRTSPAPFIGVRLPIAEDQPATVALPATLAAREELAGETRLNLDLGASNLNVAELRFQIPDAVFSRTCNLEFSTLTPDGTSRIESLSRGVIYRVLGDRGVSAVHLAIPVDRRIPARYVIASFHNGDSAPLTITGMSAGCYPTTLAFHAPEAGTYQFLTGNRGAPPPDYGLNSLRGAMAAAGSRRITPGPLQEKADFKTPPVLPGVESAGASIDLAGWTRRRTVEAPASGVISIELDAWTLAGCRIGLGDLRLIQNGRQMPYLIKPNPVVRDLTLDMRLLPQDPKHPTVSLWEISLPVDGLPALELTASSPSPLFSRRLEASVARKDELGNSWTEMIGVTYWEKSQGHDSALTLNLERQRLPQKILLQTDHGDNPPISLENPRIRYAAPAMVSKLTGDAPLFLVYGNPHAPAPQYDLRLVQQELMAAEPQPASLGAEEILGPEKREKMSVDAGSPWLWLALAGVVATLLVVVAKLLPKPVIQ